MGIKERERVVSNAIKLINAQITQAKAENNLEVLNNSRIALAKFVKEWQKLEPKRRAK